MSIKQVAPEIWKDLKEVFSYWTIQNSQFGHVGVSGVSRAKNIGCFVGQIRDGNNHIHFYLRGDGKIGYTIKDTYGAQLRKQPLISSNIHPYSGIIENKRDIIKSKTQFELIYQKNLLISQKMRKVELQKLEFLSQTSKNKSDGGKLMLPRSLQRKQSKKLKPYTKKKTL